uniref:Chloride channel protein CLC-c n=1 Tax=Tanacetum cinerariifolium TaxID=118510 RepID=A0A6L2N7C6_TANCI|nr:chloride channel protein CLC-c [Tanacetum cinerariifolium]
MVHIGACIANSLGQGGSRKYHLTRNWLIYFKNDIDRRDLITCGAVAGVDAAFHASVGRVLFALEEAASWKLGTYRKVETMQPLHNLNEA